MLVWRAEGPPARECWDRSPSHLAFVTLERLAKLGTCAAEARVRGVERHLDDLSNLRHAQLLEQHQHEHIALLFIERGDKGRDECGRLRVLRQILRSRRVGNGLVDERLESFALL